MPGFEVLPIAPMPTTAKQALWEDCTILFPAVALGQVKGTQEGGREGATKIFTERAFCSSSVMHNFIIILLVQIKGQNNPPLIQSTLDKKNKSLHHVRWKCVTNILCSFASGFYCTSNCLLAWINQQNYTRKPFSALAVGRFNFVNIKESLLKLSAHLCLLNMILMSIFLTSIEHSVEELVLGRVSIPVDFCTEPILFMGRTGWLVGKVFTTFLMKIESLSHLNVSHHFFFFSPLTYLQHI